MPLSLAVDLVPRTAWWANVRSNVSRADWEKCKEYSKSKTDGCCIICGGTSRDQGRSYDTEAHEIWAYDDDARVQTLVDIVPLCTRCHQCKHLGRSKEVMTPFQVGELYLHICDVNGWSLRELHQYLDVEFQIWAMRSNVEWELDLSKLEEILGRPVEVDREVLRPEGTPDQR